MSALFSWEWIEWGKKATLATPSKGKRKKSRKKNVIALGNQTVTLQHLPPLRAERRASARTLVGLRMLESFFFSSSSSSASPTLSVSRAEPGWSLHYHWESKRKEEREKGFQILVRPNAHFLSLSLYTLYGIYLFRKRQAHTDRDAAAVALQLKPPCAMKIFEDVLVARQALRFFFFSALTIKRTSYIPRSAQQKSDSSPHSARRTSCRYHHVYLAALYDSRRSKPAAVIAVLYRGMRGKNSRRAAANILPLSALLLLFLIFILVFTTLRLLRERTNILPFFHNHLFPLCSFVRPPFPAAAPLEAQPFVH